MDIAYITGRKLFEKTTDILLKYLNRNTEENLLKLVDWAQNFMGDIFDEKYYDKTRDLIRDKDRSG